MIIPKRKVTTSSIAFLEIFNFFLFFQSEWCSWSSVSMRLLSSSASTAEDVSAWGTLHSGRGWAVLPSTKRQGAIPSLDGG